MPAVGIGIGCGFPGTVKQWTPLDMAPTLFLDGLDAASFTLSGTDVDQWSDLSGNGYHAAPTGGGTKPTRNATTGVVSFDRAAGDFLGLTSALPDVSAGYYISLVGEITGVSAVQQVFLTDHSLGGCTAYIDAANSIIVSHRPGVMTWQAAAAITAGIVHRDFAYDGTNVKYREGGGAWSSSAKAAPGARVGTWATALAAYINGSQPCSMSLVHVLALCGRYPSTAELANHRAWVLRRYGV